MEWLDDSKACLEIAQIMLIETKELIDESLKNEAVIPYLKVKIKNFLENCRSPLDYAANYLFDSYCRANYSEKELKRMKVYFPIVKEAQGRDAQRDFEKWIKVSFKGLKEANEDVVNVLENCQFYKTDPWLSNLTFLTNENKHRNLTKQNRTLSGHIENLQLPGLNIKGLTFEGVGTLIQYGDTPMNDFSHIDNFQGEVNADFVFSDLNLPVPETLDKILSGTQTVIKGLEENL
jgi:hypothetical protein